MGQIGSAQDLRFLAHVLPGHRVNFQAGSHVITWYPARDWSMATCRALSTVRLAEASSSIQKSGRGAVTATSQVQRKIPSPESYQALRRLLMQGHAWQDQRGTRKWAKLGLAHENKAEAQSSNLRQN